VFNPNLMTIFVALTAVAILIQTGILVGFYFLSTKLSRQADQAVEATRNILGPLQSAAETLKAVSARVAAFQHRWLRRAA
jgi:hypothetical protein